MKLLIGILLVSILSLPTLQKSFGPVEAGDKIGESIMVRMIVKSAKDRLEKRGEIYLDSQEDFRGEKNFAVVITRKGASSLRKAGIVNPAQYFKDKLIQARGLVKEVDGIPRIEVDQAIQIKLVKK